MANGRKVTRVRIEYDDGSAQEVQGAECAEWIKVCDAHAGLWASRGWPDPGAPKWVVFPPPGPDVSVK